MEHCISPSHPPLFAPTPLASKSLIAMSSTPVAPTYQQDLVTTIPYLAGTFVALVLYGINVLQWCVFFLDWFVSYSNFFSSFSFIYFLKYVPASIRIPPQY